MAPSSLGVRGKNASIGQAAQSFEGVDAGVVPVIPLDLNRVATHRMNPDWCDVAVYAFGREQGLAAPFVDAIGASAGESKRAHVDQALAPVGPVDDKGSGVVLFDARWSVGVMNWHLARIEACEDLAA